MKIINKSTLIPIGMAVTFIGGGAGWATRQEVLMSEHEKSIVGIQGSFERIQIKLSEISDRLSRIEEQLKWRRHGR